MKKNESTHPYTDFLNILRRATGALTEDPIREEIFSIERLEQYAVYLATELKVKSRPSRGHSLLPEVKRSGEELYAAYLSLSDTSRSNKTISPAAEWFLDNFHIIEEQLWGIKRDLPAKYYHELPKLASGELAGYPRIYAITLAIIAHTDSRLDPETLKRFLKAYQTVSPLTIGELWAISITLRIALIQHLKPLALRIVDARRKRENADSLADRLLDYAMQTNIRSDDLVSLLAREMNKQDELDRAFVVQLTQRLRDQDPDFWPVFDWLEQELAKHATNTALVTQLEHHRQAAAQVTVGNIITSMRLLSALDWRDFFESVSLVDPILAKDPVDTYLQMDFLTRDSYRHAVERISKRSKGGEQEIAIKAIELATLSQCINSGDERRAHVGYHLIGAGKKDLERHFSYRQTLSERFSRFIFRYPTFFYLGALTLLTVFALSPLIVYFLNSGGSLTGSLLLSALLLIPASEIALSLLNLYTTAIVKPKLLPKIDTSKGVPHNAKTIVVIPTLFTNANAVNDLLDRLQVHYLGNSDPSIFFALLGDFSDSDSEDNDEDDNLLEIARRGIEHLNARYCKKGEDARFYLFHRRRLWNSSQGKWMGWERKRGKLMEFNRLLRGATDTSFLSHSANISLLAQIKYVITLDSDTQLPRNCARRLIGTIIHPLNKPHYCHKAKRVTDGYGILQPRIGVDLVSASRTRFAKIFSGNVGLDPYTTAVSDVYQDLFAEGSFTGKGLYVIDTFETALKNRGPENAILSHDLFESSFARAALVTDIELFDDYPSNYETFEKRQHRWTRGDWQIAPWLFPWVPNASGQFLRNNISIISRWKIFDNLRRSLLAPTLFFGLLLGWTILPGSPVVWSFPFIMLLCFSIYARFLVGSILLRKGQIWREHLRTNGLEIYRNLEQIILQISYLPSQVLSQLDAIARTLYRKLISRRKLLEWMTFAQSQHSFKNKRALLTGLFPGPAFAVVVSVVIGYWRPTAFGIAWPFIVLWALEPFLRHWSSQKAHKDIRPLDPDEIKTYRQFARRTWNFFANFVGPDHHWLAPDNFQEDPLPIVASRTSPTNIGLQLLAAVSALDFGYIGILQFVELVEKIFDTLDKLPKLNGHFFNWYDTQTLEPLRPQYISTVDSGNLAGHLIALKQACQEFGEASRNENPNSRSGISDTLSLLLAEVKTLTETADSSGVVTLRQLLDSLELGYKASDSEPWEYLEEHFRDFDDILSTLEADQGIKRFGNVRLWLNAIQDQIKENKRDINEILDKNLKTRFDELANRCEQMVVNMNFRFLFNDNRKIFSIGYDVESRSCDNSFYDLLASESRLASFVAIAKGDVPQEHWFRLGRQLTYVKGWGQVLVSWTATMFEYLMPLLVMRRYGETLLDQSYEGVVTRQIEYGKLHKVPWGISEAGYNARDLNLNYQYGAFGVPGLGLKRGLSEDLVIAPYSTMLAAVVKPQASLKNLKVLVENGALGLFGFYESIDYTPHRLPENKSSFIVKSYMAHHQGMSLLSLNNLIHHSIMQNRFHLEPRVQATNLLLQERVPSAVTTSCPRSDEILHEGTFHFSAKMTPRKYTDWNVSTPRTQLLSNGVYSVMLTSSGGGYSRCGSLSINRWREDWTRDQWGQFFYIRDRVSGKFWSTAFQPTAIEPDKYGVTYGDDKVKIERQDGKITTSLEVIVSPEDNVELRRVTLTNNSNEEREFEITSFMEVVLASGASDIAHPAFSNLFVQTEFVQSESTLLATRRIRSKGENEVWGFHVVACEGEVLGPLQYETDRSRFIGRAHSSQLPLLFPEGRPLSNTAGSVLDPIFSLRESVKILPGANVRLVFSTGIAHSRDEALILADKYRDVHTFSRESDIAWTHSQVQMRHLNIDAEKAHLFQRLAGRVIYSDPSLRPRSHALSLSTKSQSDLWAYGISGDIPIILTRINDEKDMSMVRELIHAHEYLNLRGLKIDLVLLNERGPGYMQPLQEALQKQIRMSGSQVLLDKPGGVFIRRVDIIPADDLILLKSTARVVLSAKKGTLEEQLERRPYESELPTQFIPRSAKRAYVAAPLNLPPLDFFNGIGGFAKDGQSYQILLRDEQNTPAPWINVVANSLDFGFVISESGSGYTWSCNSRENRLSSWSNDAVSDTPSEAIYIRDEKTGEFWTPTPLPIRDAEPYLIEHGHGYTQFKHTSHEIEQDLVVFVPIDSNVKISRLQLKNLSQETRHLSVTGFVEWVLGFERALNAPFINTEHDAETGAIFAHNPYSIEFGNRIAFFDMSETARTFTCDRKEFFGRNGSLVNPASLRRSKLSGKYGVGLDPCAAIQSKFSLAPGEERTINILLGQGKDKEEAQKLTTHYRAMPAVNSALQKVRTYWRETLGQIQIKTPDLSMNLMVNNWLLYQTLSCRIWARSAFYQSGGAYGFRDQLQDTMALIYSSPKITRAQILRAAARQFVEGDVQHWWHPPTGRGVRTRFSDDLLWLPFVVDFYIKVSGDKSILDDKVPFLEAAALEPGQDDSYTTPNVSKETGTILEHCFRALDRSLKVGKHDLPLMGSGDWNDGMNRVGNEGLGESVWVGWFLSATLSNFISICESSGHKDRAKIYSDHLNKLKTALEANAWDGDWYRRAFFDDGTPLGSAFNEECRIDSIAQSWAVISGMGDPARAERAMMAVDEHLIDRGNALIKLFTPPFDRGNTDPGYIKGYVPGVRENGGQYTHAAIWTVMAYAALGHGDRANELYALLNPINHTSNRAGVYKYKVEPYVMAADVYALDPHVGRGGWTWYTGSSSWMYRAAVESILGFDLRDNELRINPCIPNDWREFEINYRYGSSEYQILVNNEGKSVDKSKVIILDDVELKTDLIPLVDDGSKHLVQIKL